MPPDPQSVRAHLPALAAEVYLNTGGAGPLATPVVSAATRWLQDSARAGRMSMEAWARTDALMGRLRDAAAGVVGGRGTDVAILGNTTAGVNVALWGLPWRPGDEIVTTLVEHPGLSVPVAVLARRHGLTVRRLTREEAEGDLAGAVRRACGPRTRAVALSHVSWVTGAVLDVEGAAREAARAGALTVVDGAQAAGAIAVDAAALGVDAYAFPAQKWLLGPEGLGALWMHEGARARVDLTYCGFEAGSAHTPDGGFTPEEGTRRHEVSTPPVALAAGWLAGLEWLAGLGWAEVHAGTARALAAGRAALGAMEGVTVLTPPGPQAGLLSFAVAGVDAEAAAAALAAGGVIVRWVPEPRVLRASLGFFTDDADVRRLAAGVAALAP
jgi:L-cysteine/cystine lyase